MTQTSYPVPGRGAWTRTGGLLPAKAGSKSRLGYYRAPALGETAIGAPYVTGADRSHHSYVVHLGVRAIQQLVGMRAGDLDGWFGPLTGERVRSAQQGAGIEADAIVGPSTMKALLRPLIGEIAAQNGVPEAILGGLLVNESNLDPAAVGVNGVDHGLAQINLSAHAGTVSVERALDPLVALLFSAEDLGHIHEVWQGRTSADPWDVAIANHNSPVLARRWAKTGVAPYVEGRVFQIQDYVLKVRASWS